MMKELLSRVLVFIFACAIAMAVSFAHAEESTVSEGPSAQKAKDSSKEILTLKEFLRRVLKNNREILVKEKELENAKWNERSTWAAFLPSVELNLTKTEALKKDPTTHEDENGSIVQDPPGPSFLESLGTHKSELEVKQNIFNGFIDVSHVRATQLKYRQAEYALKETQSRILKYAIETYTRILAIRKYLEFYKIYVDRRQTNLDIVKLHYSHGQEDQGSVLLCQAYVDQVLSYAIRYDRWLERTQEDLAHLMGESDGAHFELDSTFQIPLEKPIAPVNGYKEMIENREEYITATFEEEFAHDEIRKSQAEFLPKLDLTATGTSSSSDLDFGRQQEWELKLELKIPLFQGGKDYYSLRTNQNDWIIRKINKETVYQTTFRNLRDSYYKYEELYQDNQVYQVFLKARRLKTSIVREKYRAGLSKFDTWDTAEKDLFDEEVGSIGSYRDVLLAQVDWWHLSGKGFDHLWK